MTCAHCEQLEEQVAWLKSELGIQMDSTRHAKITKGLRLQGQTAAMVLVLYQARGRVVSQVAMNDAVPSPLVGEDRGPKFVDVQICRARKVLGKGAIENIFGKGYRLSPSGMNTVATALGERALVPEAFGDLIANRGRQ
jgi:DNA-binding response OmpR family regulator